jgi:hypothetical protein
MVKIHLMGIHSNSKVAGVGKIARYGDMRVTVATTRLRRRLSASGLQGFTPVGWGRIRTLSLATDSC